MGNNTICAPYNMVNEFNLSHHNFWQTPYDDGFYFPFFLPKCCCILIRIYFCILYSCIVRILYYKFKRQVWLCFCVYIRMLFLANRVANSAAPKLILFRLCTKFFLVLNTFLLKNLNVLFYRRFFIKIIS